MENRIPCTEQYETTEGEEHEVKWKQVIRKCDKHRQSSENAIRLARDIGKAEDYEGNERPVIRKCDKHLHRSSEYAIRLDARDIGKAGDYEVK